MPLPVVSRDDYGNLPPALVRACLVPHALGLVGCFPLKEGPDKERMLVARAAAALVLSGDDTDVLADAAAQPGGLPLPSELGPLGVAEAAARRPLDQAHHRMATLTVTVDWVPLPDQLAAGVAAALAEAVAGDQDQGRGSGGASGGGATAGAGAGGGEDDRQSAGTALGTPRPSLPVLHVEAYCADSSHKAVTEIPLTRAALTQVLGEVPLEEEEEREEESRGRGPPSEAQRARSAAAAEAADLVTHLAGEALASAGGMMGGASPDTLRCLEALSAALRPLVEERLVPRLALGPPDADAAAVADAERMLGVAAREERVSAAVAAAREARQAALTAYAASEAAKGRLSEDEANRAVFEGMNMWREEGGEERAAAAARAAEAEADAVQQQGALGHRGAAPGPDREEEARAAEALLRATAPGGFALLVARDLLTDTEAAVPGERPGAAAAGRVYVASAGGGGDDQDDGAAGATEAAGRPGAPGAGGAGAMPTAHEALAATPSRQRQAASDMEVRGWADGGGRGGGMPALSGAFPLGLAFSAATPASAGDQSSTSPGSSRATSANPNTGRSDRRAAAGAVDPLGRPLPSGSTSGMFLDSGSVDDFAFAPAVALGYKSAGAGARGGTDGGGGAAGASETKDEDGSQPASSRPDVPRLAPWQSRRAGGSAAASTSAFATGATGQARGVKVLSKAVRVDGVPLVLTVFDTGPDGEDTSPMPSPSVGRRSVPHARCVASLRMSAYHSATGATVSLAVDRDAVCRALEQAEREAGDDAAADGGPATQDDSAEAGWRACGSALGLPHGPRRLQAARELAMWLAGRLRFWVLTPAGERPPPTLAGSDDADGATPRVDPSAAGLRLGLSLGGMLYSAPGSLAVPTRAQEALRRIEGATRMARAAAGLPADPAAAGAPGGAAKPGPGGATEAQPQGHARPGSGKPPPPPGAPARSRPHSAHRWRPVAGAPLLTGGLRLTLASSAPSTGRGQRFAPDRPAGAPSVASGRVSPRSPASGASPGDAPATPSVTAPSAPPSPSTAAPPAAASGAPPLTGAASSASSPGSPVEGLPPVADSRALHSSRTDSSRVETVLARVSVRVVSETGADATMEAMQARLATGGGEGPRAAPRAVLPPGYALKLVAYDPASAMSSSVVAQGPDCFILLATSALVQRASVEAAAAAAAQGSDAAAEAAAEALACRALQALVAAAAESSGTGVPAWLLLRLLMATEGAGAAAAAWIAEAQRSAGEDEGVADGHALEAACRAVGRFAVRLLRVVDCRGRLSSARAEEVAAAPSGAKAVPAADTPAEAAKRAACSFELEMPTAEELHQAASDARLL